MPAQTGIGAYDESAGSESARRVFGDDVSSIPDDASPYAKVVVIYPPPFCPGNLGREAAAHLVLVVIFLFFTLHTVMLPKC